MPALYSHVVLQIIESCDAATVETLRSMPEFRDMMETHRTSIVKNLIRAYVGEKTCRGKFLLDTLGDYCGPPYAGRAVIPVSDWCAVNMVERRACLVERMLQERFLYTRDDSKWPHLSKTAERETLRGMVREALHCCEVLSDIEASVIGLEDLSRFGLDELPQKSIEHAIAHRSAIERYGFQISARSEAEESRETFVRWVVRGLQRQYLKRLKTRQLLCIVLLLRLVGEGLPPLGGRVRSTRAWRLVRGINEGVLRHGAAILSAWRTDTYSSTMRQQHASNLVRQAKQDLRLRYKSGGLVWDDVKRHELSMVLRDDLKRRLLADGRGPKLSVETEVLALMDEMIRGPQTVRPTTSMFWPLPNE